MLYAERMVYLWLFLWRKFQQDYFKFMFSEFVQKTQYKESYIPSRRYLYAWMKERNYSAVTFHFLQQMFLLENNFTQQNVFSRLFFCALRFTFLSFKNFHYNRSENIKCKKKSFKNWTNSLLTAGYNGSCMCFFFLTVYIRRKKIKAFSSQLKCFSIDLFIFSGNVLCSFISCFSFRINRFRSELSAGIKVMVLKTVTRKMVTDF